jgi:hypothetical protein
MKEYNERLESERNTAKMSETSESSMDPAPFAELGDDGRVYYNWVSETGFPDYAPANGVWFQRPPPMDSWHGMYGGAAGLEDLEHFWMTAIRLRTTRDQPFAPRAYENEEKDGRLLCLNGFPRTMKKQEIREIFASYGVNNIEKIIVLQSYYHDAFRWVVFRTRKEADNFADLFNFKIIVPGKGYKMIIFRMDPTEERRTTSLILVGESMEDWNFNGGIHNLQAELDAEWLEGMAARRRAMQRTIAGVESDTAEQIIHGHPELPTTPVQASEDSTLADDESGTAGVPKIEVSVTENEVSTTASTATTIHTPLDNFVTQASSWANIVNASNLANRSIDTNPANREHRPSRLNSVGRIPTVEAIRAANAESERGLMRVVFLIDIPKNITLQEVSDAIHEGPLRSINFGIDGQTNKRYVGVVFQHAEDAERFHRVLVQEKEESVPGRFRFTVDTGRDTFPTDEVIKAMGAPTWATRRLTLVKGGFFFKCNEHNLTKSVEKLVTPDKIQRIHLYNGGNATIIFSDVASAILVKKRLDELAMPGSQPDGRPGFWEGLVTTFSKDPCVQPLEMRTAMHG